MFSLTISFMVIFILGKLTFLGTHLNLIIVMFCSERVLPCYRAAASLRSLSARVALSCTEHTAFISDLLCHWGPVWRLLGSWTILSLSPLCWPHWGTTTWRGGDCPCLSLDIAFTPFHCRAALSVHWHQDFYQTFVLWHAILHNN